jgi:hypothetical protein
MKWLRGLRWSDIDQNLVLRRLAGKGQKEIAIDLRTTSMVMEELRYIAKLAPHEVLKRDKLPKSGPIVVYEHSDLPYHAFQFRRSWRQVADSAGIPKDVRNMDTQSGADAKEPGNDEGEPDETNMASTAEA